jgi:hypothetical protein
MRWLNWRRAVAVIAMIVGIGVGVGTTSASAVPNHANGGVHTNSSFQDWWW